MPPLKSATVRLFGPEQWGEVERFSKLCTGTYQFKPRDQRALSGVGKHFEKALAFCNLAERMIPTLEVDRRQLSAHGFTPATYARDLTMVFEAAIMELYSSIDCAAKVIFAIYAKTSKGLKPSTRSLFQNYSNISGNFPDEIKALLEAAVWFNQFCYLRDELTHLESGFCDQGETGQSVRYMHPGVTWQDKPLIFENAFGWFAELSVHVNVFLGSLFRYLRTTLKKGEVVQFCGVVEGRMLVRYVEATTDVTFDSGRCESFTWFEQPDMPTCPFIFQCGAYKRTRPDIDVADLIASKSSQ